MTHRRTRGSVNRRLVVGLVLGVIGLATITTALADHAILHEPLTSPHTGKPVMPARPLLALDDAERCVCLRPDQVPGTHDAIGVISPRVPLRALAAPSRMHGVREDRDDHSDARLYLQQSAAASRRSGSWSPDSETRTILWINAPASIASTSPPGQGLPTLRPTPLRDAHMEDIRSDALTRRLGEDITHCLGLRRVTGPSSVTARTAFRLPPAWTSSPGTGSSGG